MKRAIVESPYSGNISLNVRFAKACMRDCLKRGYAPLASHLLYARPGILVDNDPAERSHGIWAGYAWLEVADVQIFFCNLGISEGMKMALRRGVALGIKQEDRWLPEDWDK